MIDFIKSIVNNTGKKEAKEVILKEFFNYSDQKKAIGRAARESAEDQKKLVSEYHKVIKIKQNCSYAK